jgi:hypothetical protein
VHELLENTIDRMLRGDRQYGVADRFKRRVQRLCHPPSTIAAGRYRSSGATKLDLDAGRDRRVRGGRNGDRDHQAGLTGPPTLDQLVAAAALISP